MSSIEKVLEIYMIKAKRKLERAREALSSGDYDSAVGDAYRCVELCMRALLLSRGVRRPPKTHGGLLQLFGEYFVKTELLPRDLANNIHELLIMREGADYEPELASADQARFAIDVA